MFKDGTLSFRKVYIAVGYTDLRNNIDGLSYIIERKYALSPFDEGTLFVFCGRKSDRIKALLWEGDGFLLLYKRIEDGRFLWPRNRDELRMITMDQFKDLLSGLLIDPSIRKADPKTSR
ncbi:MAG: IS66 family insertion sequence element accessory protein TnpB [Erysipelotrichaceae bacterium]|nr:IS66 family insertion sequence element accessory protein TnpB [Erysipelotrichaceae bacterium]